MAPQQIILVLLFIFSGLVTVNSIGKPRGATTPGVAVLALIINTVLIALVISI